MANQRHIALLKRDVGLWNQWRQENRNILLDLYKAKLVGVNLRGANLHEANLHQADLTSSILSIADLRKANLSGANLYNAHLNQANLQSADLSDADLSGANLTNVNLSYTNLSHTNLIGAKLNRANLNQANLSGADLTGANLSGANLSDAKLSKANLSRAILRNANCSKVHLNDADLMEADLRGANLSKADLCGTILRGANLEEVDFSEANLSKADLSKANLTRCRIYAVSAWDIQLEETNQYGLIITPIEETTTITIDNLEVAQFIYLLLNNAKVRDVIDTITSKVVLILGRFTPECKAVLDALRDELRKRNYSPILFDFEKPTSRDITETVRTLAHLARFIIADITDAKSIPQELQAIVPNLPSVPVQPLILNSQHEYGMFEHFTRYPWVLPVYGYIDELNLLQSLQENVIAPAEQKAQELAKR